MDKCNQNGKKGTYDYGLIYSRASYKPSVTDHALLRLQRRCHMLATYRLVVQSVSIKTGCPAALQIMCWVGIATRSMLSNFILSILFSHLQVQMLWSRYETMILESWRRQWRAILSLLPTVIYRQEFRWALFLAPSSFQRQMHQYVLTCDSWTVTASYNLFIKVWNVNNNYKNFMTLCGHKHSISSVHFFLVIIAS